MLDTIQFHDIHLEDKPIFDHYFKLCPRNLITYSFTSAYIWRHWDHYCWTEIDDALVLMNKYPDEDYMLAPIADQEDKVLAATERMLDTYARAGKKLHFTEITEDLLAMYEKNFPNRFVATEVRDCGNYIYEQTALATLSGKKYDGKRNHLHHFLKEQENWVLKPLDPEIALECKEIFPIWTEKMHPHDAELALEAVGVKDALDHFSALKLEGAALYVKGKLAAFTFGEPLTPEMYCLHVEKANSEIRGIYQAINNFYVKEYCKDYKLINRAEDMGDEGLRRSKLSYHPLRIEKDYIMRVI